MIVQSAKIRIPVFKKKPWPEKEIITDFTSFSRTSKLSRFSGNS